MTVRVLHVTEAMGAGIVTLLSSISKRQREAGAEVSVLFLERPETPSDEVLQSRFDESVELTRLTTGNRVRDFRALFTRLRSVYRSGEFDAVHLHSSLAGAIGRAAAKSARSRTKTFYSPHGFAFLRLNTSERTRKATRTIERVFANTGSVILTSQTEFEIATEQLKPKRAYLLQTGVPSEAVKARERHVEVGALPTVAMIGRVSYQKAPWRFAKVAQALAGRANFVWIGGGDEHDEQQWLADPALTITGWISPERLEELIDEVDVLLFPSLWEGMSLSLIQAQSQGIPAVVSDVVGNRDSVKDGVTGFVCADDEELTARTSLLIDDPHLRTTMSLAALDWARTALTDDNIGVDSLAIYTSDTQTVKGS